MMHNSSRNYFELFNLPTRFAIDLSTLDQHYRKLQSEVHPDRFAMAPAAERLYSIQLATQTNEAYRTLKDPTARARYLLQINGVDTEEESNTAMPAEFLVLQMELREAMEDARAARNIPALDKLLHTMQQESNMLQQQLHLALDERKAYPEAAETVRKLRFLDKVRDDIQQSISRLED